jgi:hypothetical protein
MRKLKLELDALEVESFEPADGHEAVGTVRAHDSEDPPNTDFQQHTCNILSCGGTCALTPNVCGSCGCGESGFDPCG